MSMNGNFARSILCSLVTSVDFGWYSGLLLLWSLVLLRHCGARPNNQRGKYGNENDCNKIHSSPGIHSAFWVF